MGRFSAFLASVGLAGLLFTFVAWAWPTISTISKALAMVLILAFFGTIAVPVLTALALWSLVKGLAGSFDDFFPKKPTAKWILLALLLPLTASAWDLPPAKKILDEKINEYRELRKSVNLNLSTAVSTDAVVQFGSSAVVDGWVVPPIRTRDILRIDKDGDIFLRGKWIGWDGRLKGMRWR